MVRCFDYISLNAIDRRAIIRDTMQLWRNLCQKEQNALCVKLRFIWLYNCELEVLGAFKL